MPTSGADDGDTRRFHDGRWVTVVRSGRGGSVEYGEDAGVASFSWELAMPPARALVFGTGRAGWDAAHPWAAGRQVAVFAFVAAEVARRAGSGSSWEMDLERGIIEILEPGARGESADAGRRAPAAPSPAWVRFQGSIDAVSRGLAWHGEIGYDLDAASALRDDEAADLARSLALGSTTWREVSVLSELERRGDVVGLARAGLRRALRESRSADTRLAAAEALHAADPTSVDIGDVLVREIELMHDPNDGLVRALRLARAHDGDAVRRALLYACRNRTACAPTFAHHLLGLTGARLDPPDAETVAVLSGLGLHVSDIDRRVAFDALCARVGMSPES